MRILVIAPQPFYQERGTPIATRLLIETLTGQGHAVDVLTYHVGSDPHIPGVRVFRTPRLPWVRDVPIGFSLRKLACDLLMAWSLLRLARRERYDVLHAVEEAVYLGMLVRVANRGRLVYDMDSSLVEQLLDKYRMLRPLGPLLCRLERAAIARSDLVIAVCSDLAARAQSYRTTTPIRVVEDVSLLDAKDRHMPVESLRRELPEQAALALYVGNLEPYQGVGLLLDALATLEAELPLRCVVIGGQGESLAQYRARAQAMGIESRVEFLGARPVDRLGAYLAQADILVSPRLSGHNTPMKLYSYLGAGKPLLATNIRSHTQVLSSECALLVEPNARDLGAGLRALTRDAALRQRLGNAAGRLAASRYSLAQFRRSVASAYGGLAAQAS
jgi:glycosyltransferase involved in cell wall biosynthesis